MSAQTKKRLANIRSVIKAKGAAAKDRSMLIKDINPATWQAFKMRAAKEGRTVKWLFDDFIERYAGGK
jgi:hypothetical protein